MGAELALVDVLAALCCACLLATFGLAAAAKLRDRALAREGLRAFGVPERLAGASVWALALGELLVAALLAAPPTRPAGALSAAAALALFTLAILRQLLRGRRPACACFGALSRAPLGWWGVARNALLLGAAGAVLALPGMRGPAPAGVTLAALAAAAWGAASAAWLLLLTRQNGRLLLRLEQLERGAAPAAPAPAPPRAGDPLPPLGLSDPAGRPFDTAGLRGRPALLLFLEGTCAHCRPLLARLRAGRPAGAALVVVSADPGLRRELPDAATLLIDPSWAAAGRLGLRGTPAAALVGADGALALAGVHGGAAVGALLDQYLTEEAHHELAPV